MKHVPISDRWAAFERIVLPPDPRTTDEIRRLFRLVFYAGAAFMNNFMTQEVTDVPDDEGVERIEMMQHELREFARVETAMQHFLRGDHRTRY